MDLDFGSAKWLLDMASSIAAIGPINLAAQTPAPDQAPAPQAADPLAGSLLYEDVKQYETFGIHRYGSVGANAALDWIAGRLAAAGLSVEQQRFSMDRQYFLDSATIATLGKTISVLPQWWIPEDQANFELTSPIERDGDATGKFVRLHLSYDQGAYLNQHHRGYPTAISRRQRKPGAGRGNRIRWRAGDPAGWRGAIRRTARCPSRRLCRLPRHGWPSRLVPHRDR